MLCIFYRCIVAKKGLVTENHFWKSSPNHTTYAVSKYAAEREVWRGMEEGLNAVIVNPSLIIGPGCWNQSSGKLITNAKIGIKFLLAEERVWLMFVMLYIVCLH